MPLEIPQLLKAMQGSMPVEALIDRIQCCDDQRTRSEAAKVMIQQFNQVERMRDALNLMIACAYACDWQDESRGEHDQVRALNAANAALASS